MAALMDTLSIYEQFRAALGEEKAKVFAQTLGAMIEEAKNAATKDDIRALREAVDANTARVDAALATLAERMVELTDRVDTLAERMDQLTARVDTLAERMVQLTARVDASAATCGGRRSCSRPTCWTKLSRGSSLPRWTISCGPTSWPRAP